MRIGINALFLLPTKVGGTEIYIRNLVKWLAKVDQQNEYRIFVNKESEGVFKDLPPNMNVVLCPIRAANRPVRILWEQVVLPVQLRLHHIDVLLSAGMTSPFICPSVSVLVILDLQHRNQPQNFAGYYRLFLRMIIYLSSKTSDAIIAISQKVKSDIEKYYKISGDRISAIYLAADRMRFFQRSKEEISCIKQKYNLPERFILYIASSLPHKNYQRLLEAYQMVQKEDNNIKLVLIGARGYGDKAVLKKIRESKLEHCVLFLGWLPAEDIPVIYCASEVFVFPSLHEGFGIPVLEAMACGVPVVCSRIEPLTEVAGEAALFVDPLQVPEIAEGILSVLRDGQLRERLVKEGLKRAEKFSWEETALGTLSVLCSTVAKPRKRRYGGRRWRS
ncbi:MAG: glycosyltransferase family 1 protein [Deltaproteobacteria bacterium]